MKKILSVVALAALLASCCGKQQSTGIAVEKFFENPSAFVGTDTTFVGIIKNVCDSTGIFILSADSASKFQIVVTPPACAKACKGCVGKEVFVKGVIKETVVDEEFVAALENESNAEECPHAKACKQKKVAEYKEALAVDGTFSVYSIEAKCVKAAACCKDGEKKACCKDGEKKACCKDGEKKDSCCKDGEKKDSCCKDGEKKDSCCKDGEKKDSCKDGEKKDHKHGDKKDHKHGDKKDHKHGEKK